MIYGKSLPGITASLLVKAYLLFPYYIMKIYQTLLLRQSLLLDDSNYIAGNTLTESKTGFYDDVVSIIIPVYNGGDDLKKLIPVLLSQEKLKELEIIAIDSGSNDDSVKYLCDAGIKVIKINKNEFSHSGTRNLGAKNAKGNILLFMTQDALPNGNDWVFKIINPIYEHGAAAASCVEKPHEGCGIFSWVENNDYVNSYCFFDSIICLKKSKNLKGWWEMNTRLNNVSCAIKKDVFDSFLFKGAFAEDVDMAVRLLKGGYGIAFLSSIFVTHSHERSSAYCFGRSYLSAKTLYGTLPGYSINKKSLFNIVLSAQNAYCWLNRLFEHIISLQGFYESENFIGLCTGYCAALDEKQSEENFVGGLWFSSAQLDDFFALLFSYSRQRKARSNLYIGTLKEYLVFSVKKYIYCHNNTVDENIRKQVIDALYKKFLLLLAEDLALFFCRRPDSSNPLYISLEEFSKGI